MNETVTDRAQAAARRSSTWWLLSRLITEPPLEPWLDELESVLASVEPVPSIDFASEQGRLLAALRLARAQSDGLTALGVDRTRLLSGVFQNRELPAPYESAALGEPMNGDRVFDVSAAYDEAGFDNLAPELGPPDYLATELRFMALLCFREMEAHQGEDPGLAPAWLQRQLRFMDLHVLAWIPTHCRKLEAQAATPFYAALANLLGRACLAARDDISMLMEPPVAARSVESAL